MTKATDAVGFFSENVNQFGELYRVTPEFRERMELWHALLDRFVGNAGLALDLGCGTGIFTFYLAQKVGRVVGIDGSAEMIAACERTRIEKGLENVKFMQARLPNVAEPELRGADVLISSSVIEYVDDLSDTLALFARLLKPDGLLIVSMPNAASLSRTQQRMRYKLTGKPEVYGHIKHFSSPSALGKSLRGHGFRLLESHYYTHFTRIAKLARGLGLPKPLSEDLFVAVFRKDGAP